MSKLSSEGQRPYWLMKTEPEEFSIDDLQRDKTTWWQGVRNYQARNFMRNDMRVGDPVFIYHSSVNPPGIVGLGSVSRTAAPDESQWNETSPYFDPKSPRENPRWHCVQIRFLSKAEEMLSLERIRGEKRLARMALVQRGQRLSVQPVEKAEFEFIAKMMGLKLN